MFVVILRFSNAKNRARELMTGHNEWITRGFREGVFLVAASLEASSGGAIIAHDISRAELDARIQIDPFVAHDVVTAEVLELSPSKMDPRLTFVVSRP